MRNHTETRCAPRAITLRRAAVLLALAALLALPGCNVIDAVRGKSVSLVKMVPGGNISNGGMDCWITMEIKGHPSKGDPRDLRVRFTSDALTVPAEFDWGYIADNDVLAKGGDFGSGYRSADSTTPDAPPPIGETVKVRFPLNARAMIDHAPSTLWLKAEIIWGGKVQDSDRRTIEHVYSRTKKGFF